MEKPFAQFSPQEKKAWLSYVKGELGGQQKSQLEDFVLRGKFPLPAENDPVKNELKGRLYGSIKESPFTGTVGQRVQEAASIVMLPSSARLAGKTAQLATDIATDIASRPFETVGAVGGSVLGSTIGPVGTFGGGIAGATGGKELDEFFGFQPNETVLQNLGQAAVEETVGSVASIGGRYLVRDFVHPVYNSFIRKMGFQTEAEKEFNKLVIKEEAGDWIDPTDIIRSQERLLGSRMLTSYEETAGQAGALSTRNLAAKVIEANTMDDRVSALVKRNKVIQDKIKQKIAPVNNAELLRSNAMSRVYQDALKDEMDAIGKELDVMTPALRQASKKLNFSVNPSILDDFDEASSIFRQGMGDTIDRRFKARIYNALIDSEGNIKPTFTFADFQALEKDLESIIGEFNTNATYQKQIAGEYASTYKPVLEKMIRYTGAVTLDQGRALRMFNAARDASMKRAADKNILRKQHDKIKSGGIEAVYKSLEDWQDFTVAMRNSGFEDMIAGAQDKMRQDIYNDLVKENVYKGGKEFKGGKLEAINKKYGADVIEAVLGREQLNYIRDADLIAKGMTQFRTLGRPLDPAKETENIPRMTARTMLGSVFSRINLIAAINDKVWRKLFVGEVADKDILQAMTGERGQRIIERSLALPLTKGSHYLAFYNLMREVTKNSPNAEILSYDDFMEYSGLKDVPDNEPVLLQTQLKEQPATISTTIPDVNMSTADINSPVGPFSNQGDLYDAEVGNAGFAADLQRQLNDSSGEVMTPEQLKQKFNAPKEVSSSIVSAAEQVGVDAEVLFKIAQAESSFDPKAKAKTSSAKGLFQFLDGTWKDVQERLGADVNDPFDPYDASVAAATYIKDIESQISQVKPNPDARDIYLAYFSGAGRAKEVISALENGQGDVPANKVFKTSEIKANRPIFYTKDGKMRTLQEVYERLTDKVG